LSVNEVQALLVAVNLNKFRNIFLENEVDGETLCECQSTDDLQELGITFMPKCRMFLNKLDEYKANGGVPVRDISLASSSSDSGEPPLKMNPVCRLSSIVVSGAVGNFAVHINGTYDPTSDLEGGFAVYKMRSQDVYMEYNATRGHWHVKSGKYRGSTNAWLYVASECMVPHAITNTPHIWLGDRFTAQMSVKFEAVYDPVMIAGCEGSMASQVNGIYDPTEEQCG
jgi:hypothetical protein